LFSVSCFLLSAAPAKRARKFFSFGFNERRLMKTYRNLYPQVWNFENLYTAYRRARKGKRSKPGVAGFERQQEEELLQIQQELCEKTYSPGNYHSFTIHEPKRRLISAAPFRDRVVHHALCQVMEPVWEPRFIHDSYANRLGKGTHRALDRTTTYARRYGYFLQCDVRQFFPSIDLAILRSEFARLIRDDDLLWLCDQVLASGQGVLSEEYQMVYFPGDDLFAANRPRGLPIGNLTSQFWANIYLNGFDQFVKRELHCPAYLRYVDDFLLFSDSPHELLDWLTAVQEKMAALRLTLHIESARVNAVKDGIPFLGFRVYPDHRRVKRRKVVSYRRKLRWLVAAAGGCAENHAHLQASVRGWVNHVAHGDTYGLRRSMLDFVVPAVRQA
jgi:retron-type reverse transcriptase